MDKADIMLVIKDVKRSKFFFMKILVPTVYQEFYGRALNLRAAEHDLFQYDTPRLVNQHRTDVINRCTLSEILGVGWWVVFEIETLMDMTRML